MFEKEEKIREQRTIEATRKGLIGLGGKLGVVVQNLGQPITVHSEGGSFYTNTYLSDPYDLPGEEDDKFELKPGTANEIMDQIPTMQVRDAAGNPIGEPDDAYWAERPERTESHVYDIGWHFDGLNRGIHLEIKYIEYNDIGKSELTVYYKGYLVYQEVGGDLAAYSPFDEWEDKINNLYAVAQKTKRKNRKDMKEQILKSVEKEKLSWLQRMRKQWGI